MTSEAISEAILSNLITRINTLTLDTDDLLNQLLKMDSSIETETLQVDGSNGADATRPVLLIRGDIHIQGAVDAPAIANLPDRVRQATAAILNGDSNFRARVRGDKGDPGLDGDPGKPGKDGKNGIDGTDGETGERGKDGPPGKDCR